MKYMKRAQIYKASNVTFNPETKDAYSYGWWRFVGVVEGKVVFSNYSYSTSTGKHQRKVRSLLEQLGIKIDITLPLPRGVRRDQTLAEMIVEAEEYLCDQELHQIYRRQQNYLRSKAKRLKAKLEDYLENSVHFRDYDIVSRDNFANPNSSIANKVAVHQCVDAETLENDVQNAIYNFQRDGFGSVVFYIGGL